MELHESSQVVQNLLRKRDLLLQGDRAHEQIRSALVICGGAMRGVYGAGAGLALQLLGLHQSFDVVVGISTGALVAAYFLDDIEQGPEAVSIYYNECLDSRFINFTKWPIVNVDYIESFMRGGRRPLDIGAILKHRSQFFVGATDWESGEGHFLDVKCAEPEPLAAIKASCAITELYRKPVMVNGGNFTDGSNALPFPAKKVLQHFEPTDILVIANCSQASASRSPSWTRKVLTTLFTAGLSPQVRALAAGRSNLWTENLEHLRGHTANVGIIWGPNDISQLTRNYDRLLATAEKGVRQTLTAFGQPELPFTLL